MTRTCVFLAALVSFAPASNARAQSNPDQREVLTIMKWHRVAAGLVVNIALPGNVTNQAGSAAGVPTFAIGTHDAAGLAGADRGGPPGTSKTEEIIVLVTIPKAQRRRPPQFVSTIIDRMNLLDRAALRSDAEKSSAIQPKF